MKSRHENNFALLVSPDRLINIQAKAIYSIAHGDQRSNRKSQPNNRVVSPSLIFMETQYDWDELPPMVEFAYHYAKPEITGISMFKAKNVMLPQLSL